MSVKAKTKNIGISVKKLRPYVNLIRGKKAVDALNILSYMNSSSSETLIELIKSAIANAESSQYGVKEDLIISTIYADKSTTIRRWRARARGRAGTFNRPQSHIYVELKDENFFKRITNSEIPVLLLLNKIDKSNQELVEEQVNLWKEKVPNAEIFAISALENFGVPQVFNRILELLPDSPPFYDKEALTDKPERFFVNEIIREKILLNYKKEIPYSVEVETEEFFEEEEIIRMRSVIMVERDTQKGIIIGHKGSAIKRVGVEARKDLEKFFGKQVHLELYVKVNKNWRSDDRQLKRFGYNQN